MKKQDSFFSGWLAYTLKDPETILETIWEIARVDFTGLQGFSDDDENILEFTGIRIRKDPISSEGKDALKLLFEITDATKIQPEFLDLWDFLVANDYLYGKLSAAERKQLLASLTPSSLVNKKEDEDPVLEYGDKMVIDKIAFSWLDRGYTKSKESNFEEWISHEYPGEKISRDKVYKHLKELLRDGKIDKPGRFYVRKK
jgi:hypothetical protein